MSLELEFTPPDVPLVVGLGDPVMDILANVSPEWLATVAPEPGGCLPVPPDEMEQLLAGAGTQSKLVRIPGGSAANVVKGIANIASPGGAGGGGGGGVRCRFVGMIGTDETGAEYRQKLAAQGVEPLLLESGSGAPSACAVCLVTPDGQRTMRTCLGASLELRSAEQLPGHWARGCRLLHAEGYCLYRPQLAREMMTAARQGGALVSLDLASFELVRNCRDALLGLLQDGLVDLIFANEEEAITLCQVLQLMPPLQVTHGSLGLEDGSEPGSGSAPTAGADTDNGIDNRNGALTGAAATTTATDGPVAATAAAAVAAAQRFLLSPTGGRVRVAVTSLGARGCVARGSDGEEGASPACRVALVDTIGAGDFFTSGFLSAYLLGASLQQCCAAGCAAGAEAVQVMGAELPPAAFERLRAATETILATQPAANGDGGAAAAVAAVAVAAALAGVPVPAAPAAVVAPPIPAVAVGASI